MKLSEDLIRKIALTSIEELGENNTPEVVKKVVLKTIEKLEGAESEIVTGLSTATASTDSNRIILTAYGVNKPGIIHKITGVMTDFNLDILDLSQKILQEYFTMIMIVDLANCPITFGELRDKFQKLSDEMNIRIIVQHEDVFKYMHRI